LQKKVGFHLPRLQEITLTLRGNGEMILSSKMELGLKILEGFSGFQKENGVIRLPFFKVTMC